MSDEPKPKGFLVGPPLDSAARESLVRRRRFWRRVKALGAVALGLGAGTFLACYSAATRTAPAPAGTTGGEPAEPPRDAALAQSPDAGGPSGPRDAGPAVDVDQHRDGMPVPDNLLE